MLVRCLTGWSFSSLFCLSVWIPVFISTTECDLAEWCVQASDDVPSFNIQAKESSKEEEVLAICQLRKVDKGAPVALQLKALDEEYHHLLDSGQSGKADHVQGLYAWYSKKISQVRFDSFSHLLSSEIGANNSQ